jgi:hypothetical protein
LVQALKNQKLVLDYNLKTTEQCVSYILDQKKSGNNTPGTKCSIEMYQWKGILNATNRMRSIGFVRIFGLQRVNNDHH